MFTTSSASPAGKEYFFPGVSGPELINISRWVGALITGAKMIGTRGGHPGSEPSSTKRRADPGPPTGLVPRSRVRHQYVACRCLWDAGGRVGSLCGDPGADVITYRERPVRRGCRSLCCWPLISNRRPLSPEVDRRRDRPKTLIVASGSSPDCVVASRRDRVWYGLSADPGSTAWLRGHAVQLALLAKLPRGTWTLYARGPRQPHRLRSGAPPDRGLRSENGLLSTGRRARVA